MFCKGKDGEILSTLEARAAVWLMLKAQSLNFNGKMLSEKNTIKRINYCMILFVQHSPNDGISVKEKTYWLGGIREQWRVRRYDFKAVGDEQLE